MRGLKYFGRCDAIWVVLVASYADAWIEIDTSILARQIGVVASYADAWIEMLQITLRWRGPPVASYADAWIEIHVSLPAEC
ncbi:permease component II [Paenibacillus popilliae ATCC 14706]|uniref:Permease component II n=1 Tax=Paenibacillus popilliae ATCC 14706 TaxID=1212764 RepID=M9M3I0_PAEPP|nr:permease component II [Paenibacillus popilliae ATCC 14706]